MVVVKMFNKVFLIHIHPVIRACKFIGRPTAILRSAFNPVSLQGLGEHQESTAHDRAWAPPLGAPAPRGGAPPPYPRRVEGLLGSSGRGCIWAHSTPPILRYLDMSP